MIIWSEEMKDKWIKAVQFVNRYTIKRVNFPDHLRKQQQKTVFSLFSLSLLIQI